MRDPSAGVPRHLLILIGLLFAAFAVFGQQSLPPYPQSWTLLYQSNLSTGSLSDWTMVANPKLNLNGRWSIVPDGTNWALEGANEGTTELVQRPFSDFLAHFRLRLAAGGGLFLLLRQQGCAGESAWFAEDAVNLIRRNGCGSNTDFGASSTSGSGLTAGAWSAVDLIVNGGAARIYVDGVLARCVRSESVDGWNPCP